MNRAVIVLVLVLSCLTTFAQVFYRSGTTVERVNGRPVECGGYLFVNCAATEVPDAGASFIYKYDSIGNVQKFWTGKYAITMQATMDSRLLLMSQERRCTFQLDTLTYFLDKLDIDGAVKASAPLLKGASPVVETADTGYIAFLWDHKTMLRFDKNLNVITQITHTLGMVQGAVRCHNGQIAVSHLTGTIQRFSLLNSSGQVLSSKTFSASMPELRLLGPDRITGYALNNFYVFDYSLNLVNTYLVKHFFDYFIKNDSVYALTRDSLATNVIYAVFNKSMHVVFKAALSNYTPVSLGGFRNRVAILSDPDVTYKAWLGHNLVVTPKLSSLNPNKNMWLNTVIVDSSYFLPRADGFYDVYARFKYDIRNGGPPVNTYNIVVTLSGDKLCGINYSRQKFTGTVPQSGKVLAQSEGFLKKTGTLNGGAVIAEYCIILDSPDGEYDGTPVDNLICPYVYLDINSVGENNTGIRLSVYPNPAEGMIRVSSNQSLDQVELMNVYGQLLSTFSAAATQKTIDVSGLQPGVYLLRARSGNQLTVKRFITR